MNISHSFAGKLKLRTFLLLLVTGAVLLTAVSGSYFAWQSNQAALVDRYLQGNEQYARKQASNLNDILQVMLETVQTLSEWISDSGMPSESRLHEWLSLNRHYFNAVFIVDESSQVVGASPSNFRYTIGKQAPHNIAATMQIRRAPFVTTPFTALRDHYLLVLTAPIMKRDGSYAGYAAGAILLDENNALCRLLTEHFYDNGSYLYVADRFGRLAIHPDKDRLREFVSYNEVVQQGIRGGSGSQKVKNGDGELYLAGYAYEPLSGLVIVSQTPASVLKAPAEKLLRHMLYYMLPVFFLIWLTALLASLAISRPLHKMARFTQGHTGGVPHSGELPPADSRIAELWQLQSSLNRQLKLWSDEVQRDGLTGLANRKTFDAMIRQWLDNHIPFSLILMDVDHFKGINDTFGHLVGDQVLQQLASQLRSVTREGDLCFRYGGEEFGILVRYAKEQEAVAVAERLRKKVSGATSPSGRPVSLSLGVATCRLEDKTADAVIDRADKALYRSKENGRNQTNLSP
ncbi:sensor domain-containing diguanylate cyclase [Paenibacillus sp. J5C_2022]|uniref:sensor domain-containing diguanylate cyclase n=1 Tax=Paenibacillus sp. J5C2022 TaxID=2977129 RepID=UPI0021D19067|nr:sensor domain-containing diguanylate cyclase [Paenibacillus sp. J5C2022]MCU6707558.1 sensor domain-containing diguanylate cyclase [Paenibacillus sp. J5C2022]